MAEHKAEPERPHWGSKVDFILAVVGFAVGLGNVWRFPYLCYKNGGGAFFIPYLICLVTGGVPVFFLEIALGQYMSQGGIGVWKIAPIFTGIGLASTVIVFLANIYYIVVLAWDVNYMVYAFNTVLPWSHCNNSWNTPRCQVSFDASSFYCNTSDVLNNCTEFIKENQTASNLQPLDPVVEFWENKILQISPGIDQPDGIVWQLALSLLFVWVLCYFCVWKGVKWTGKVVYFTATFPYVVLTVLLVRGVTLDGASDGIKFYLMPDFDRLLDSQVWIDAGTQIFYSYALALGAMTALGSYNKFHNNCYRDCVLLAAINSFTSIFAGFAIFSVLGFMAKEQGVPISEVAESGPGLAFIAYPKAVTQMPAAPLWAILFFFMILMLGLDSQVHLRLTRARSSKPLTNKPPRPLPGKYHHYNNVPTPVTPTGHPIPNMGAKLCTEAFMTIVTDFFPSTRKSGRKEIVTAVYCLVSFLLGLPMVTRGGMYVFQLFDYYVASGMTLLWVCFFETIAVAWVFGVNRFYDCIELMIGYKILPWLKVCWKVLTPIVTMGIFIFMWVQFKVLTYNRTYEYPMWAQGLGMFMGFMSMVCIPGYIVIKLALLKGTLKERWTFLCTPVLHPDRIPDHWEDAAHLRDIGCQHYKVQAHSEMKAMIPA